MPLFFGGFEPLGRIAIVGTLSYLALILIIRLVGQRPLGRMQTFDLIVAVAIGSTYGRLLTAQEVQFTEAATAFAVLMGVHYAVAWLSYRLPRLADWLETRPVLMYYKGEPQRRAMRRYRMTEADLLTVARRHGLASLAEAEAIVMEGDGSFSVLMPRAESDWDVLTEVEGRPPR